MGPILAGIVHETLAEKRNRQLIEDLRVAGLNMEEAGGQAQDGDRPLEGKTFVLTGTLEGMSRDEAAERITALEERSPAPSRVRRTTWSPAQTRVEARQGAGTGPPGDRRVKLLDLLG